MTDITLLQNRADALHGRYQLRFAGHARITRRLSELDDLINDTRAFLQEVTVPEAEELRGVLKERLSLYETERGAIVEAQAEGPLAVEASILGQRANFAMARYRRHFAGKPRKTRDLGLLAECGRDLEQIQERMTEILKSFEGGTLKEDIDIIGRSVELYKRERGEIVGARGMALIDQKAETLAEMANLQFELYRQHFAGRGRVSRRPGLLKRIIANLEQIRDQMQSHKAAGLRSTANDNNIRVVVENLKFYRRELKQIQDARRQASTSEQVDALANAANTVMAEYNEHFSGQNRATRDPELLSNIADRMGELEKLMTALSLKHDNETNSRNLSIVRDMLNLYEREYTEVLKAKRG